MDAIQHKLDAFTKAVTGEIAKQARHHMEEAKGNHGAGLSQAKAEIAAQVAAYKRRRIQEIHSREGARVSAQRLESRRGLFAYRQAAAETVRAEVLEKIQRFTEGEAYPHHLKTLLNQAIPLFHHESPLSILLRPQDMVHEAALAAHVSGRPVAFQPGMFALGGLFLLCPSQAMEIDFTFDTALESAMGRFLQLSGMNLT